MKFNNSLQSGNISKETLKHSNIRSDNKLSNDPQIKLQFLEYQIRKFAKKFFKMRTKEEQKQREDLEKTYLKKVFEKAIPLRKIGVFTMHTNNIS